MIIKNRFFPIKGFVAMNFFGILIVRRQSKINNTIINHEQIHTAQMKELAYILFYLWYILEWLFHLCICFSPKKAYQRISFEREAYANQKDLKYLQHRKHYNFIKWVFNR